ncbi:AIPR family protein [Peribacillus sp. TH16]|uniref:AIPR family protein n=1 Tax=Peribacillus sp. TH16 TaxID=2798482 RepID=UPI001913A2EB|nr:AIPR family protein [Peribacillus sp. TH16]MBK5482676.1 AIPR family protein [Peribacillus sp. TH16]
MNNLEIKLVAEDVATMKETTSDGVIRSRRWIKVEVDQLKKALTLREWTEINPREQNLNLKPAKEMRKTLNADSRDIFHYLNRGISLSVAECKVRNLNDKKEVFLKLSDVDEHGIFDGGHTIKVLFDALDKAEILGEKHVLLEVFTGVEDILFDLARARNTSTQVKEKSIANLEGKFDFIKEALKKECFYDNISWTENEDGDISINFIIQVLTTFNHSLPDKSMRKTYSGAGSCETAYINEYNKNVKNYQQDNVYYKLTTLYSKIFKLVDHILVNFPSIYNKHGYESERGNFGKLKGVTFKQDYFPLLFTENNKRISYKIPNSLFFPILASMRQLYKEAPNGMYEWIHDPIDVFDEIADKLVTKVMGVYFEKQGAVNEVGKTLSLWIDTYEIVSGYLKEQEIKELKKQLEQMQTNQ